MKKILLPLLATFIIVGCSSPPPPPKVEWDKKKEVMNSDIMSWRPNYQIIKSDKVTSTWGKEIVNFAPENSLYDDTTFYAIAHSDRIIVETNNENLNFFEVKSWLRSHGAYGLIEFKRNTDCLTCTQTNVYLIRNNADEKK